MAHYSMRRFPKPFTHCALVCENLRIVSDNWLRNSGRKKEEKDRKKKEQEKERMKNERNKSQYWTQGAPKRAKIAEYEKA